MNDFDYDVMLKKRIARGAIAKKNGCKSKKCTLPQDQMTEAQLKRRNGDMATYEMKKPMAWNTFKKAPNDIQKEYVSYLRDKYNVNNKALAEMFRVSPSSVCVYFKENGLRDADNLHLMDENEKEEWKKFVQGEFKAEQEEKQITDETDEKEPSTKEKIKMGYCNVHMAGDVYGMCKKLVEMLGAKTLGQISFTFSQEKEDTE